MLVHKSPYFDTFRCIASACPDSCCKDWDVQVDDTSAALYRSLSGPLGDRLREVLHTEEGETVMSIIDGRCPMWRQDGLCRIHSELGEEALCPEFSAVRTPPLVITTTETITATALNTNSAVTTALTATVTISTEIMPTAIIITTTATTIAKTAIANTITPISNHAHTALYEKKHSLNPSPSQKQAALTYPWASPRSSPACLK